MRRAIALVAALSLAAPALAKTPAPVKRGHELARQACASCHAVEPGGTSPNPKAAPLASRDMRHVAGIEGRLARLTREGHYGMPPQALTDEQVRDLLAYIESLAPR
ncbi:c-type cytochrome [Phenylobacterium kunshanense]|jgi:mono/diheme cytochrome c family protein|uniref:Cytochrome c domain-containing protein n=1 Tax=Phenylobacterium kunshanense TaxID=1445034 RepID=A0A328BQQ3_9CAUL|nr:cytochrome c [Phenylobacterium kunshanense]RAK67398.1 hypothetical protein DJ019_05600 [Phenylobacterium kunshanense]